MNIYYEDIMEDIEKENLREKLITLVKEHGPIKVIGLSSRMRYLIYKEMYHPLKFEKIIDEEEENKITNIKIYNYTIKTRNETTNVEETPIGIERTNANENTNEDDFVLSDNDESDNENETEICSSSDYTESYITDEEEYNVKLENLMSQCLEKISSNKKILIWANNKVNILLILNIIGWMSLYLLNVQIVYMDENWKNYGTCSSGIIYDTRRMLKF